MMECPVDPTMEKKAATNAKWVRFRRLETTSSAQN